MIVGCPFEGDNVELAWQQHEVYGLALGVIAQELGRRFRDACITLSVTQPAKGWPAESNIDHRTLQSAHDRLAATWRYRVSPPQAELKIGIALDASMNGWLEWLRLEMASWDSQLVGLGIRILQNQNTKIGYKAEDWLEHYLCLRFEDVEWSHPAPDPNEV